MEKKTNNITQEIDQRLRAFINTPDNFLDSVAFVNAIHHYPVWASDTAYAIEIDGKKVIPVFTDDSDLETFKSVQESAQTKQWVLRSILDVLDEALVNKLYGLVVNLKKAGDFGNTTTFKSHELVTFINHFTAILNKLMTKENESADLLNKYYLVPAFPMVNDLQEEKKQFPTMANPEGDIYVPVFSNFDSFARWYNHDKFGYHFRKDKGQVFAWTLSELKEPKSGKNDLTKAKGVVINPFDEQMTLLSWEELS